MDLQESIIELAEAAGIDMTSERISHDRCWIDGSVHCPYGSPEGQYILRPEGFCNGSCTTFVDNCDGLLTEDEANEQVDEAMVDHFREHKTTLASRIREIAEALPDIAVPQKLALQLAVDIIEDQKLDCKILLETDLPK